MGTLMSQIRTVLLTALLALAPLRAAAELSLIMVQQDGCPWCMKWNEEIGPIYPKTEEGKTAPLRRIDLHEPVPEDLTFKSKARLTPTFILVDDGMEIARLEGYPGEDFFWGMLDRMLDQAETGDDAPDEATKPEG
jgi:thioredoxin-related protein